MNDLIDPNNSDELVLKQSSLVTDDDRDDLGAGVRASLPVIGYRGQVWWLKFQKEELALVDDQGYPVKEIGVCFLRVPGHSSKRYYMGPWKQGENRRPDCWSDDGKKPHPTAVIPVQPDGRPKPTVCSACYMDQIGSMVSDDKTKRMKACSDYKRTAIKLVYPNMGRVLIGNKWGDMVPLEDTSAMDMVMLLPIPAGSLTNFTEYGRFLESRKAIALGRITYVGFVPGLSFPKMTFRYGPEFDDQTYLDMRALRNSDDAKRVLERDVTIEENGQEEPHGQVQAPVTVGIPTTATAPVVVPIKQAPPPPPSSSPPAAKSPFAPGGRPVRPVPSINTAIAKPAAPPPSVRQVVAPEAPAETGEGYSEADIPAEIDSMFNALKLDGKTTD